MRKLFHWGPLIAISIIKCVSLTTLYYTSQWLRPFSDLTGMVNLFLYLTLIVITLYNFLTAVFNGPGYVPYGWRPRHVNDEKYLQFCYKCNGFKAPRSHHCSKCNRCILKMDHHCPWINNCCGYQNQKNFFYFLLSAVIGSLHSLIALSISFYRALNFIPNADHKYIYLSLQGLICILLSIGMSLGVVIAVGGLLYIQTRILLLNRTSIEDWILNKANNRKRSAPFIYPYNLGLYQNIYQVLFEPLTDGTVWPVRNDCNQFTLTYEQILQKKEKQLLSTRCRIVSSYNGNIWPLFSQGFRVCFSFPINDNPRLAVNVGDEVVVTHWQKRWLYGYKISKHSKIRQKGWFPEKCAVIFVKAPNSNEDEFDYEYLIECKNDEVDNKKVN